MKNINKFLFGGLALSLVLSACSIEKRVHNPGYHISWKNAKHATQKEVSETDEKIVLKPVEKSRENLVKAEENAMLTVVPTENQPEAAATEVKAVSPKIEKQAQVGEKQSVANTKQLSSSNDSRSTVKQSRQENKIIKKEEKKQPAAGGEALILLIILAILIPVIAVGIVTDWETGPVLLSILLMLLFYIPAIIHALILVLRD